VVVVPEQVKVPMVQQVLTQTQQQAIHQAHLEKMVQVTQETAVAAVLVVEVPMEAQVVMVAQETMVVPVVGQGQTQRQAEQNLTDQVSLQVVQVTHTINQALQ
tara:strand:- start:18 stop:326 length:309 start_codon:yes stop_codon:yes gene_type:complete